MYTLKKSLGQHFLNSKEICIKIVDALHQNPFSRLLEVGPGGGALTGMLLDIPQIDFKAIEIDLEKVNYLQSTFPAIRGKIIEADILEASLPFDDRFTIIGNFPYNISTQIVFKILDWRDHVETMIGMFQKEVALRICASPGNKDYGILSVLTQAYYSAEYLFDVNPECFNPPPKVISGVIRLKQIGNPFGIENHKKFQMIVKAAFGQRRKQLRNPLKPYFEKAVLEQDIFSKRAEQLSVADFVYLVKQLK
jgi:16S rRNA (adenine1518-N6/adenine1519-N6)-dimethyltransferase